MPDAAAFMPPMAQSEYAFPAGQGDEDEAGQAMERNRQIQAAFDAQRFQHGQSQSIARVVANQAAQIAQLRQRALQK